MKRKFPSKKARSVKTVAFVPSVKKGVRTLFYWVLGVALLPVLWASLVLLARMMPSIYAEGVSRWWLYGAGAIVYILFDRLVHTPMTLYVLGHELTHALSGFMSGARIHSMKARSTGGEVRLSKTNLFISLSPYVIPLYALLVVALYSAVRYYWPHPAATYTFQFLLGSALAFHALMTYRAVHKRQPDLKIKGFFLSTVLVSIGNVVVISAFLIALFTKTPTLKHYGETLAKESWRATVVSGRAAVRWAKTIRSWTQSPTS